MFDYGMLTDNKGHKVDCRQTLVIMTSNAGVAEASKPALGFGSSNTVNVSAVTDAVNRITKVMKYTLVDRITSCSTGRSSKVIFLMLLG